MASKQSFIGRGISKHLKADWVLCGILICTWLYYKLC